MRYAVLAVVGLTASVQAKAQTPQGSGQWGSALGGGSEPARQSMADAAAHYRKAMWELRSRAIAVRDANGGTLPQNERAALQRDLDALQASFRRQLRQSTLPAGFIQ
jgi:hypothetical protein